METGRITIRLYFRGGPWDGGEIHSSPDYVPKAEEVPTKLWVQKLWCGGVTLEVKASLASKDHSELFCEPYIMSSFEITDSVIEAYYFWGTTRNA